MDKHKVNLKEFSKPVQLITEAADIFRQGELQPRTMQSVVPDSFRIGEVSYNNIVPFFILDSPKNEDGVEIYGDWFDGIVGTAVLNAARYCLDFQNLELRIGLDCVKGDSGVPMALKQGFVFANATINDKPVTFLIDTGATNSKITWSDFARVTNDSQEYETVQYGFLTIDGIENRNVGLASLSSFRFGNTLYPDLEILIDDANVIGIDILSNGVLVVDPSSMELNFYEGSQSGEGPP